MLILDVRQRGGDLGDAVDTMAILTLPTEFPRSEVASPTYGKKRLYPRPLPEVERKTRPVKLARADLGENESAFFANRRPNMLRTDGSAL